MIIDDTQLWYFHEGMIVFPANILLYHTQLAYGIMMSHNDVATMMMTIDDNR